MPFDQITEGDHEQVTYFSDTETGLKAIVAIHDTTLGPALGGTRLYDYETEADALADALQLSEAMTYKAAAAGLDLGGGKAVILGGEKVKSGPLLEAYGRIIASLGGRFVTSVDMNTTAADMSVIGRETDNVVGTDNGFGDPSPVTATGIRHAIHTTVEQEYGRRSLDGVEVVVQGLGKVGGALVKQLTAHGATVTVSDLSPATVTRFREEHGVDSVAPEAVYDEPCDLFVPAAIGGVIDDDTVSRLSCDAVVGVANNSLAKRRHAVALDEQDVTYVPDYVANAGGLVTVEQEYRGGSMATAQELVTEIGDRLETMFERADAEDTTLLAAAETYAEQRLTEESGKHDWTAATMPC
ncbi:MAG: glutamate dehydrogenase/leucine dehydrogenase [halophilic archaeon J07HX5]|jgi:Glutamate dehydrogenase/leucine dehydrogenase|nr:MAG: glutamate dehydrogenase/leucine dehydrogenase [halophilic archaeon J07HX5]